MRREDFGQGEGANIPGFLKPPLSRWHIEQTLKDLESWGFFVRVRSSRNRNHGGRYAYSVRCKDGDELINAIRKSKAERGKCSISENRERDLLESLSIKENRESPANDQQPPNKQANKSPATQIERPVIEDSDIKTEEIKISMGHTTNKVGGAPHSLLDSETGLVKAYNRFCERNRGKGFLKVDQVTSAVRGALDTFDGMEPHELLEILEFEAQNPRGGRTFVRCVWNNYH